VTCDKDMKPPNSSLSTIEQHLRGKPHREIAAHRLDKAREYSSGTFPTTIPSMDLNLPPAPLAVFAHQGQPQLATIRNQYFAALESDSHAKAIQTTLLQARVAEFQKITTDKLKGIESSLATIEEKDTERQTMISEIIVTSEEKHEELTREVVSRVKSFEAENTEKMQKMADDIASTGENCTSRIDNMTSLLARSDFRNIDKIDTMSEHLDTSDKRSDELAGKIKDFEKVIAERDEFKKESENLARKIMALEQCNQEKDVSIQRLWGSVFPLVEKMKAQEQVNESQKETNQTLHILEDQLSEVARKIKEVERINEAQKETNDTIHDLESQYQLLTEGLQRRDEADDIFQKAMTDQIEAHLQQIQKQMALLKEEYTDSILKTVASEMETKLQQSEREMASLKEELKMAKHQAVEREKQSSKRIRSLERRDEEKQGHIKRFDRTLPLIFDDFNDLRAFVKDDTELRSATRQSVSPSKARTSAK